jgi:hypothetical protein
MSDGDLAEGILNASGLGCREPKRANAAPSLFFARLR